MVMSQLMIADARLSSTASGCGVGAPSEARSPDAGTVGAATARVVGGGVANAGGDAAGGDAAVANAGGDAAGRETVVVGVLL
ncbi:MAG: hypothetical protein ACI81L_001381 [Verrucomicrobiales bacterium]|jgi:hypothetical protein